MMHAPRTALAAGLVLTWCISLELLATTDVAHAQAPVRSRAEREWHTLVGERHGVSYFRRHRFPEVEYAAGEELTFDRYHTAEVMYEWLRRWEARYPELIEVYEVGRSYEGRPILQATITNERTGTADTKPAAYFEGGRHSGEVSGSESALWLAKHLLEGYGRDAEITQLLDTRAVHIRPQNNPDGSALYLNTAQSNRSTVRPHDSDRDGLVDEDPPEDLDGDGVVYEMRWRVTKDSAYAASHPGVRWDTAGGNATLDERDPTGRLMKRVPDGAGDWRTASEGVDNDGDGRLNEDGIGGLDLHRNYAENWRPEPGRDATRRGWTQGGAGAYPLSEPETRLTVIWLLEHPNVSVVNSMDTRVPMHLRPPSTSPDEERMYAEDRAYYERFDSIGVSITGYPWAGDVYDDYATRDSISTYTGEPTRRGPLFGHGPDFGYWYFGAIWYGDELWNGGAMGDLNGDGRRDQADALVWDDTENGGRGFREWTRYEHPELGTVEIGGFHPKFFSQNAPPEVLEEVVSRQALFNLELVKHLPVLELSDVDVRRIAAEGDSATYEVTVAWKNAGLLPTALRQARLVKIVQEDRAELEFDRALTRGDSPRIRIIDPALRDKTVRAGWTEPGETKSVTFRVRRYGNARVKGKVRVLSTRGGVLEEEIEL